MMMMNTVEGGRERKTASGMQQIKDRGLRHSRFGSEPGARHVPHQLALEFEMTAQSSSPPAKRHNGWGGARPGSGRKPKPKPLIIPNHDAVEMLTELRRLADRDADLKLRLAGITQASVMQTKQLAETKEMLDRVLRHQVAIARQLQAIETPAIPRHTRRRPLGM